MNTPRHCYNLADFEPRQVAGLLDRAETLRAVKAGTQLHGRAVVLLFLASSLRTRVSMELAARQLGAHAQTLQADAGLWKMEYADGAVMRGDTVEHVKDAIGVLARYADLLGVRAFPSRRSWAEDAADPVLNASLRWSPVPVVNMESTLYHPCQALADLLTIRQTCGARRPGRIVLSWADHPKPLPVAVPNSFALAVTQMGWDLVIARPEGYDLPPEIMTRCRQQADAAGSRLEVTADRAAAFGGAQFVYAKSWGRLDRYGQEAQEIEERRAADLARWIVDPAIMALTDNAYFMHCLPVRRNVVVSDAVIDGPRSLVLAEAENRLHAQKALLAELLS
jgi:N-acetylornithine carbamoyltransferase